MVKLFDTGTPCPVPRTPKASRPITWSREQGIITDFVIELEKYYEPINGSQWSTSWLCIGFDYRRVREIALTLHLKRQDWCGKDFRIRRLRLDERVDQELKKLLIARCQYTRTLDSNIGENI